MFRLCILKISLQHCFRIVSLIPDGVSLNSRLSLLGSVKSNNVLTELSKSVSLSLSNDTLLFLFNIVSPVLFPNTADLIMN